ncbi:MAG: porin [Betaproteobacteria bacterium]|nr:MAG: porin [Betaproteobacteria bacterium]
MKKSLIVLATAGAFAVPSAAMAVDVSFGGEFDLAFEIADNGKESWNQMNNTHSRFWWDMVDDLGTGLQVKGHLELDVGAVAYHGGNTANNPGTSACLTAACNPAQGEVVTVQNGVNNRNSYIGLAGESWGEVRFGTQENIHEATGYAVDPFHGAAGPGGNIVNGMGQSGIAGASQVFNGANIGARRTDSTITYISPNWGGFTFQVDYALEGPTGTGREAGSKAWTELYYGARFDGQLTNGGWRVYAAGADISNGDLSGSAGGCFGDGPSCGAGSDTSDGGYRVGGGLTWGNFGVDFIFETNEWDSASAGGAKVERDGWWLGGFWNVPTGKLAIGYVAMDDYDLSIGGSGGKCNASGALENGAGTVVTGGCSSSMLALGYYHTLSANSSVYAIYATMDNDPAAASNLQSVGAQDYGEDPSVISLGMYLVF